MNVKQALGFAPTNLTSKAGLAPVSYTKEKIQQNAVAAAKQTVASLNQQAPSAPSAASAAARMFPGASAPAAAAKPSAASRMMFPGASAPSTQASAAARAMFPGATSGTSSPVMTPPVSAPQASAPSGYDYNSGYPEMVSTMQAGPDSSFYEFSNSGYPDLAASAQRAAMMTQAALTTEPKPFTAIVKAEKPSIWIRILQFLGFKKSATMSGEMGVMTEGVGAVVRRARAGDQNAMAIIALIRDNAAKGNPKARISMNLIKHYIATHPVD